MAQTHEHTGTGRSLSAGRSIGLYGATGTGKTTLVGEYAAWLWRTKQKRLLYHASDMGGFDSILPHVDAGMIVLNEYVHGHDDPWNWIHDAVSGKGITDNIGAVAFDSAASMGEALLNFITKSEWKVGQQNTQRFTVNRPGAGTGQAALSIGLNNEAHYGLVQTFMLDSIWASTWLVRQGLDIIWTFGEWRGEDAKDAPVIGPAIVGKALTPKIPKWLKYTLRTVSVAQAGLTDRHLLQLAPQPEMNGTAVAMANARWPQGAGTECPAFIEPASLVEFFRLHGQAHEEATQQLARTS